MSKVKHIVLGVTGSIAAYKSADIIRRLTEKGFRVSVVMTKGAEEFITPLTLGSLSCQKVYRDFFNGNDDAWQMPHIELAKTADAVLIAPATANTIAKLACAMADDLLSCLVLGTRAPVLIAPAMNTQMYENKLVKENCQKLKGQGFLFIEPIKGKLACGTIGDGHLAEVEEIVAALIRAVK